jgi:predicted TPR repeat methyltransferase
MNSVAVPKSMENNGLKSFYDRLYDTAYRELYEQNSGDSGRWYMEPAWKAENLVDVIPPGLVFGNALEVGCASGLVLKNIGKKIIIQNKFGVDITPAWINPYRKDEPEGIFLVADAGSIPFKEKSFDLVVLADVLEHADDAAKVLVEVKRLSVNVVMKIPLERCLKNSLITGKAHKSGHLHEWSKVEVFALLRDSGLVVLNHKTVNPPDSIRHYYKKFKGVRFSWMLIYLEKLIYRCSKIMYDFIFGTHLFVFCRSKD